MADTMRAESGGGIAAPQVGVSKQVLLIDCQTFGTTNPCPSLEDPRLLVMINPTLELSSRGRRWTEACLSAPGFSARVRRAESCSVTFYDANMTIQTHTFDWPLAGAVQHEYDHLIGELYFEKADNRYAGAKIKRALFRARSL